MYKKTKTAVFAVVVMAIGLSAMVSINYLGAKNAPQPLETAIVKTEGYCNKPERQHEVRVKYEPKKEPEKKKVAKKTKVTEKLSSDTYTITFYCVCLECCEKLDGITASGARVKEGVTVAAPKEIPFGTKIHIEGVGDRIVQDVGGKIKNKKLDVYVESHKRALQLGTFKAKVTFY